GVGAKGNTVAVDIEIAPEGRTRFQVLVACHFAAVVAARIVPGERFAQALVHGDVQVHQLEYRRLQTLGQIESLHGEVEALLWIFGEQQHVLGVAVRRVGAGDEIGLLRARRHTGRRAAALHVEDDRGDLREVGETDELLHQRDAGSRGAGKRAR